MAELEFLQTVLVACKKCLTRHLVLGLRAHIKRCRTRLEREGEENENEEDDGRVSCSVCLRSFGGFPAFTNHKCPMEQCIHPEYLLIAVKPQYRDDPRIVALLTEQSRQALLQAENVHPVEVELRLDEQLAYDAADRLRDQIREFQDAAVADEIDDVQFVAVESDSDQERIELAAAHVEEELEEISFEDACTHLILDGDLDQPTVDLARLLNFRRKIVFPSGELILEIQSMRMIDLDAVSFVLTLSQLDGLEVHTSRVVMTWDKRPQFISNRSHFKFEGQGIHKYEHIYLGALSTRLAVFKVFLVATYGSALPRGLPQVLEHSIRNVVSGMFDQLGEAYPDLVTGYQVDGSVFAKVMHQIGQLYPGLRVFLTAFDTKKAANCNAHRIGITQLHQSIDQIMRADFDWSAVPRQEDYAARVTPLTSDGYYTNEFVAPTLSGIEVLCREYGLEIQETFPIFGLGVYGFVGVRSPSTRSPVTRVKVYSEQAHDIATMHGEPFFNQSRGFAEAALDSDLFHRIHQSCPQACSRLQDVSATDTEKIESLLRTADKKLRWYKDRPISIRIEVTVYTKTEEGSNSEIARRMALELINRFDRILSVPNHRVIVQNSVFLKWSRAMLSAFGSAAVSTRINQDPVPSSLRSRLSYIVLHLCYLRYSDAPFIYFSSSVLFSDYLCTGNIRSSRMTSVFRALGINANLEALGVATMWTPPNSNLYVSHTSREAYLGDAHVSHDVNTVAFHLSKSRYHELAACLWSLDYIQVRFPTQRRPELEETVAICDQLLSAWQAAMFSALKPRLLPQVHFANKTSHSFASGGDAFCLLAALSNQLDPSRLPARVATMAEEAEDSAEEVATFLSSLPLVHIMTSIQDNFPIRIPESLQRRYECTVASSRDDLFRGLQPGDLTVLLFQFVLDRVNQDPVSWYQALAHRMVLFTSFCNNRTHSLFAASNQTTFPINRLDLSLGFTVPRATQTVVRVGWGLDETNPTPFTVSELAAIDGYQFIRTNAHHDFIMKVILVRYEEATRRPGSTVRWPDAHKTKNSGFSRFDPLNPLHPVLYRPTEAMQRWPTEFKKKHPDQYDDFVTVIRNFEHLIQKVIRFWVQGAIPTLSDFSIFNHGVKIQNVRQVRGIVDFEEDPENPDLGLALLRLLGYPSDKTPSPPRQE